MTFTVSQDTDRDDLAEQIGAEVGRDSVRVSDAREGRLSRNVRRQARDWGTTVDIDPEHRTAHVEHSPDSSPHVVITGREIPQPTTDYDGRAWDWMVQRAFGVHEVGHIRYTDFDDMKARLNGLPQGDRGTARSLDNAFEDGAIELQLTKRWENYYSILRALRANLFTETTPGIYNPEEGGYVFPVAHAMQTAILDLWMRDVYDLDVGTLGTLLDPSDTDCHFASEADRQLFVDEALPVIAEAIPDVLTTPNAVARNEVKIEAIQKLVDLLDDAEADGRTQQNGRDGEGDDGSGMPDDSRDNHSGEAQTDATELGEVDPDDVAESMSGGSADDADDLEADDLEISPGSGDMEIPDDIDVDVDLAAEAAERANDDAREEAGMSDELLDELDEMSDTMGAGDGNVPPTFEFPVDDTTADERRYQQAQQDAKGLEQILKQRLQSERRTKVQRAQRRGRFTGRGGAMARAQRGEKRIKEQRNEPDEKDYTCVIALDGSGSMTGQKIEGAEVSVGMMMMALEAVGVDVMLVRLKDNKAVLDKPMNSSTKSHKDNVFSGSVGGGTPMTQVLALCRERLNRKGGNKFMMVATDGRPANSSEFENELSKCTFPVIGINIVDDMDDEPAGEGFYHREVKTTPDSNLQQALTDLLNEVMF